MNNNSYEDELLNILESNIQNKRHYITSLIKLHPDQEVEIMDTYNTWDELNTLDMEPPSSKMDKMFYESLSEFETKFKESKEAPVIKLDQNRNNIFTLKRLGIAMTFLLGIALGGVFDLFDSKQVVANHQNSSQQNNLVKFASLQETPLAADRIKGIINAKNESKPNSRILAGLNNVICNDPNINVRLSAIETLVLFWDIPEAREILIKAIPLQQSPLLQLELADIMISMEARSSGDKWNQLLSSDELEPDIKEQLHNTLKEIL